MTANERAGKTGRTRSQNGRPTIGFLVNRLSDSNCFSVWQGVTAAAREHGANVITFAAHDLGTTDGFDAQANVLYDMVSADVLDGLVAWTAPLVNYAGPEGAKRVLDQYRPLPIVIIETGGPEDIPRVEIDSYGPVREMVTHLVKDHGYRRIAFIRGPDVTHTGARDRYQGYLDGLDEHGLPLDPDLVSPPTDGLWGYEVGETAISLLLDQRHVSPEAVVAVNDDIAAGAMRALEARGIHVPDQVAVTGFDDKAISNSIIPPLTTIALQGYEHARQATKMLLTLLDGGEVPARATVPFKLVIRQSCGCVNPAVEQAAAGPVMVGDEPLEAVVDAQRETILSAMRQAAEMAVEELDPGWAEQLLETFFADLKAETPGAFLSALDGVLRQVMTIGGPVGVWANIISAMRRCVLPYLGEGQMLRRAGDLWLQAQVLVGEDIQLTQRCHTVLVEQQTQIARQVRATLATTFDLEALPDILIQELPRLGIPCCYLSLYENPQRPIETSRLLLAYDERRGRFEPEADKRVFPSRRLVSEGMLPQDRPYSMVVEPLYFRENQIGLCLFEVGPQEGSVYDGLREEISSALQGALLVEQVENRAVQLQTAAEVSRAAISTLELSALLQQVVNLVQERFDLYYVGLFLVSSEPDGDRPDSRSTWAMLRAASGEAGAQMLEQGHRLEVGGESMIGQCVADHQPRIALDVGKEAVRFNNPLLPDTHSEMALPLITREGAIGALSVQSTERAAFGEAEIAVFETLAGQLANAIANARAYTEIQGLNERLKDENLRMGAELAVTQRLQQMLLPTEEELRQIENLDIVGFMRPADEVGGDYYDVLKQNGQIKIGIGDVTGHGLESGVVMLMLQTAVRTLMTNEEKDPVRFLNILNRLLQENTQRMQVSKSMTLALLDYRMGQMRVSGQHEQVIVVREGGQVELKDTLDLGFPLGLVTGVAEFVHETSIDLQPGDGIMLYSDGITEAENEAGAFYGLERLCQVVSERWSGTAEDVKNAVVEDVLGFIGNHKVYDDITLVVVKQR